MSTRQEKVALASTADRAVESSLRGPTIAQQAGEGERGLPTKIGSSTLAQPDKVPINVALVLSRHRE